MLFSELCTIMVNKVNSKVLRGTIAPLDSALFLPPADANGFDVPQVQSSLLEFNVKAHA